MEKADTGAAAGALILVGVDAGATGGGGGGVAGGGGGGATTTASFFGAGGGGGAAAATTIGFSFGTVTGATKLAKAATLSSSSTVTIMGVPMATV